MYKLYCFVFILCSNLVSAQIKNDYIIKAGKVFDSKAGIFLSSKAVYVKDGKIADIKDFKDITTADKRNFLIIDQINRTLLPGLIDAHTHLLHTENVGERAEESMQNELVKEGIAFRAISGAVKAEAYLKSGITAIQDLGNSGNYGDVALRKAIRGGLINGPRMRCSGPGIAAEGAQLLGIDSDHQNLVSQEYSIINGTTDAVKAVRTHINQGVDVIKIYATNSPNKTSLDVEEMRAVCNEAHRLGIKVTAHATDSRSIENALAAGVDGIEHAYEISDSTLIKMARKKVVLVPTDADEHTLIRWGNKAYSGNVDEMRENIKKHRYPLSERLARAARFGVIIALGSDDYHDLDMIPGEATKRVMLSYADAGLKVEKILQIATLNGAIQLNWSDKIGQIAPGFEADIIAVENSIAEKISSIMDVKFVMKAGKVFFQK